MRRIRMGSGTSVDLEIGSPGRVYLSTPADLPGRPDERGYPGLLTHLACNGYRAGETIVSPEGATTIPFDEKLLPGCRYPAHR